MLDGFQYLEERDASDKIVRAGVVSKKSAFVSPENAGIYDAIAKDLRLLAEATTSLADDANLQQILTQVKSMYDDMRTNPNFGSTAARAAAEDALKQAQAAAASAAGKNGPILKVRFILECLLFRRCSSGYKVVTNI